MYSPSSTRAKGFVYSCLALCFLALAAYKAYFLAFTHDESLSYLDYVIGRNSWEVIRFAHHASANNHPLNSLLMKGCYSLFGAAEWALRLPNLLAAAVFAYAIWRLLRALPRLSLPLFFLGGSWLLGQAYFNDFFSLARGYGLSYGFFLLAFAQLYLLKSSLKGLAAALLLACLSVYANFSQLIPLLALLASYTLYLLLFGPNRKAHLFAQLGLMLLGLLGLGAAIAGPISGLIERKELYFGGEKGLLQDTIGSLAKHQLQGLGLEQYSFLLCYAYPLLLLLGLLFLVLKRKENSPIYRLIFMSSLLLSLMSIGHILAHKLFGVRFLIDRTALIYLPFIQLLSFALFAALVQKWRLQNWLAGGFALLQFYIFAQSWQPHAFREWTYEQDNKAILAAVSELAQKEQKTYSLGTYWLNLPSFRYYQQRGCYPGIQLMTYRAEFDAQAHFDFYYIYAPYGYEALKQDYRPYQSFAEGQLFRHK